MNYIDTHKQLLKDEATTEDYDFWSAAWCVSTAVGRSVYVDLPTPLFLNLNIFLCSSKGLGKEERVIQISEEIIRNTMPNDVIAGTQQISTELRNAPTGQVAFTPILVGDRSYLRTHSSSLADLAANPTVYGKVRNPYVTMLGAIQPDKTRKLSRMGWPHFLFVSRRGSKEQKGLKVLNVVGASSELTDIRTFARETERLILDEDAKAFLENFYRTRQPSFEPYPNEFERFERNHVIRLAAIIRLSQLNKRLDADAIREALPHILRAKRYGSYLWATGSSRKNPLGVEKIRSILTSSKHGMSHKSMYYQVRTWLKSFEYNGVLSLMLQHGAITSYNMGKGGGRYYIATNRMQDREVWEQILNDAGYLAEE